MIINLLYEKNNLVRCSDQNTASNKLVNNLYSPKTLTDVLSWKYKRNNDKVDFTVISSDICYLNSLDYEITGTYTSYKISTSLDYVNWTELPFKTDGYNTYIFVNTVSGINQYQNIITKEFLLDTNTELKYTFTYLNKNSGMIEDLYNKYEFKYIKFSFFDVQGTISNPLFFNSINIMIDEDVDFTYLKNQHISNRTSAYTKSKIYNTYTFIPELVTIFSKMLETNNAENKTPEFQNILLQQSVVEQIQIDQNAFDAPILNLSLPIGQAKIGFTNQVV